MKIYKRKRFKPYQLRLPINSNIVCLTFTTGQWPSYGFGMDHSVLKDGNLF